MNGKSDVSSIAPEQKLRERGTKSCVYVRFASWPEFSQFVSQWQQPLPLSTAGEEAWEGAEQEEQVEGPWVEQAPEATIVLVLAWRLALVSA